MDDNETSPALTQTVTGIFDPTNSVYDDIDLSGNGLVGRIKRALGLNPLEPGNPLSLTQIITGEEPDAATFEVPISYNALTNFGMLSLWVDGKPVSVEECKRGDNGSSLLLWYTTYDGPGQHFLQARLSLNGLIRQGSDEPDTIVLDGMSSLLSFRTTNVLQFDPFYSEYDLAGGAILYARLPESDAEYTIELRTSEGDLIKTISGTTSTGVIDEAWNLTDEGTNSYTGDSVTAVFNVTLTASAASGTHKQKLRVQDAGYVPDGQFTIAYAWDVASFAQGALRDCIQWGVVDTLIKPTWAGGFNADPYFSTFNDFSWSGGPGVPGYLSTAASVQPLLDNLTNDLVRNFHFYGHGSFNGIGNDVTNPPSATVDIASATIADLLNNHMRGGELVRGHPFRFVFLDACETADAYIWSRAFGVRDKITSEQLTRKPENEQAFVGWVGSCRAPNSTGQFYDYAETYAVFYGAWMNGATLDTCIRMASSEYPFAPSNYDIRLAWPLGKKFPLIRNWKKYPNTFKVRIHGYAGIKRRGYEDGHDNSPYYP